MSNAPSIEERQSCRLCADYLGPVAFGMQVCHLSRVGASTAVQSVEWLTQISLPLEVAR